MSITLLCNSAQNSEHDCGRMELSQTMDKQTCPFCNQPVKADQEQTMSELRSVL
jgi:hypothetical protein